MNVNFDTQLNFKANLLSKTSVKKKFIGNFYYDKPVSFIEFDLKSMLDRTALIDLEKKWFPKEKHQMENYIESNALTPFGDVLHLYGITKQKKNLKEIDINKVLCIAAIADNPYYKEKRNVILNFIQTKPIYLNNKKQNPKIKHCGKSLLNKLKDIYAKRGIELLSINNSMEFYKKNGFELVVPNFNAMIWKNPQEKGDIVKS